MQMNSNKELVRFVEVSSGIYFIKESNNVGFKKGTYVNADTVIRLLNSTSTEVVIENKTYNELWNSK